MTDPSYNVPSRVMQDRAERIATAILQLITAKPKTSTTELHQQLTPMIRDEIVEIEREIASNIHLQVK
jgi:hypothetical protein